MKNRRPGVVVAGLHSGSGKTLVTLALLQGLQKRGYVVRPFSAAPILSIPDFMSGFPGGQASISTPSFCLPATFRPCMTV